VKIVATHTCMSHRGVKTPDVPVTTVVVGGAWEGDVPGAFR
jgi:GTP cyclohydrolase I